LNTTIRGADARQAFLFDLGQRQCGGETEAIGGAGRVTTFQNSAIFCGVKCTGSPLAISRATLSTAIA
jgi:hypothetical protein